MFGCKESIKSGFGPPTEQTHWLEETNYSRSWSFCFARSRKCGRKCV